MRIITGKSKGRGVAMPKGIRPTQGNVRKAIFDILGDVSGVSFLELFAGSGAVGFEAASRGAAELTLVECNPECVRAIKKNIAFLKLESCVLYSRDARDAIRNLAQEAKNFDIIFLDPPYYRELAKKTLQMLDAYDILAPNGMIVVQHFRKDNLPDNLKNLALTRQKHYGDTTLSFFKRKG